MMAYHKNWRKRHAEVQALAAEESGSNEEACGILSTDSCEDEASALSPSINSNMSDYESDAIPLSSDSDTDPELLNLSDESDEETAPDLGEEMASWATRNSCKRSTVNELLDILRRQGHRLPKDARTLLKTPKKVGTVEKCGGTYAYFGLASGIMKVLSQNPAFGENDVGLSINIDGIPLFKSSNMQMWPILCSFHFCSPFIVALYCGQAKPNSVKDYLSDFLTELQQLEQDGIIHGRKTLQVTVKAFICDAPARAFLKCIKNHNSYYACERCTIKGTYVGRVVLGAAEPGLTLRSDAEFDRLAYKDHQQAKSPLTLASISCIHSFALDYMHLVCLGVVRRMLNWFKCGPATCKLSFRQRTEISERLQALNGKLPSEFARQPRSLLELDRWKATELRQFLLYTGPVVLRKVVSGVIYSHFLRLMVAMAIFLNSNDEVRNQYLNYARDLMMSFVKKCQRVYGDAFTVYNVHSLIHLADDVEYFGCSLNDISSFPFENYLQRLKRMVRQSRNPIAQVAKRLTELEKTTKSYRANKVTYTRISSTTRDGCFLLQNEDFAFVKDKRPGGVLVCDILHQNDTESFFKDPCDSKIFSIVRVRDMGRVRRRLVRSQEIQRKVVALPADPGYILFPMLHDVERH